QRREAEQQRPVVVAVTSRAVVADRVDVPHGTTIVKLDAFEEADIEEWLNRWRQVNMAAIADGNMRQLTASAHLHNPQLAQQPLLLLMRALYAADPETPALDSQLATADLYQGLLDGFSLREAAKDLGGDLRRNELKQRAQDHLDRLAIAALAMFNRGRQDIDEEELGADLAVLDPRLMERSRPADAGRRIIGEFFFVHAAEARPLTGSGERAAEPIGRPSHREEPRRTYEFLHATFGEYLVARRVMDELIEVAGRAFAGRRGPTDP